MRTRDEHLQWCKDRATEYLDQGDLQLAYASFLSDMSKHPETKDHSGLALGIMLAMKNHFVKESNLKNWINGFN